MAEKRTCTNPFCLESFAPNLRGATKDLCGRCYAYARRHQGATPGPRAERVETVMISIRLPKDFAGRVAKVSNLKLATWVTAAATIQLEELERAFMLAIGKRVL